MLSIWGRKGTYCDGVSRRDFLRIGCLGAGGLMLPDLFRARAAAGVSQSHPRSVIMICLPGGPSHLDMYDMKPNAPDNVRGEFKPIKTNVPGMEICELLPKQAKLADKFAIVRNLVFKQPDHQLHEVYTGFPGAPQAPFRSPPLKPAFGSIVSRHFRHQPALLPRYISFGLSDQSFTVPYAENPIFLGSAYGPFEPNSKDLSTLILSNGLTLDRLADRKKLMSSFDSMRREVDTRGQMDAADRFTNQALDIISSTRVRDALDVSLEPAKVRELYGPDIKLKFEYQAGHTIYNSKLLLARRLVEAGVPVVTLTLSAWDHHGKINAASPLGSLFERSREQLPHYDHSICALLTDLHQRGLDKDVAVVVWGEFGRTPWINSAGGRDHWPAAGFAMFFGGGFRTGQVIGKTAELGQRPVDKWYTPQNVLSVLYHHLGIDPDLSTYPDPTGRPTHYLEDSAKITELL
jgi:hypothetical protein